MEPVLFHAVPELADDARGGAFAGFAAVARVVGELDGVEGGGFVAEELQDEGGGGIADIAAGVRNGVCGLGEGGG